MRAGKFCQCVWTLRVRGLCGRKICASKREHRLHGLHPRNVCVTARTRGMRIVRSWHIRQPKREHSVPRLRRGFICFAGWKVGMRGLRSRELCEHRGAHGVQPVPGRVVFQRQCHRVHVVLAWFFFEPESEHGVHDMRLGQRESKLGQRCLRSVRPGIVCAGEPDAVRVVRCRILCECVWRNVMYGMFAWKN